MVRVGDGCHEPLTLSSDAFQSTMDLDIYIFSVEPRLGRVAYGKCSAVDSKSLGCGEGSPLTRVICECLAKSIPEHMTFRRGITQNIRFIGCVTKINPKRPERSPNLTKWSQKGAKREPKPPKWSPKGAKREPKGAQREPFGAKGVPKGSQNQHKST